DRLSDDSRLRIEYFVEDILAKGYNGENLRALCDSFSELNFTRRFRHRDDPRPTDTKIRNFFDDVYLGYVLKGKAPTKEELEKLYSHDCR
ncbi:hypothetical protein MEO41_28320, partial [Dolichospermum sp. ST_sed4]|nr:hypothetical protein [Dolichospermum sp. ST_sed4]